MESQTRNEKMSGGVWRNKIVLTIMASSLLLQLGVWTRNFAILLYVTDRTNNNAFFVSLISVLEFAPIFLFSFIGGTFADRWKPKRTMVWSDLLSALSVFAVLFIILSGVWQAIFFAALVSSILSQFSMPSAMRLFKQHVPGGEIQSVMAMFQSLMAIFMIIGPVIGTYVYQNYGIYISIGVMGVMFLLSAAVLTLLPKDKAAETKGVGKHLRTEMADGFRYVMGSRILRAMGLTFTFAGLAVGLVQPLMLFVAIENLRMTKEFLQWILMTNGFAMLVGGGVMMMLARKITPDRLLALGIFVSMIGTIGIGWSNSIPLTLFLEALNGFFMPAIHIGINTLILKNTEESFVGRVNGVLSPMFIGMMVIGMSFAGIIKSVTSLFTVFLISGGLFFIAVLLLLPLFSGKGVKEALPAGESGE